MKAEIIVPAPVVQPPTTVTLTMTLEEAKILKGIAWNTVTVPLTLYGTNGNRRMEAEKVLTKIYDSLSKRF